MSDGGKKKRSEEWDLREKEWTDEMRRQSVAAGERLRGASNPQRKSGKKFNPKNRFKLMLVCLGVLIFLVAVLWLTMFDASMYLQASISMFSAIITSIFFLMSYGKDIVVSLLNALTKSSLR